MAIPLSSPTSYVTPDEFLLRKDVRPAGELVLDDGGYKADLTDDLVLNTILLECSGLLESAVFHGGRYAVADIQTLIEPPTASGEMLKGIICDLAAHRMCERRWASSQETLAGYQLALQFLDRLRNGDAVLPLDTVASSSNPVVKRYTQQDWDHLDLVTRNRRCFGDRNTFGPWR